MVRVSVYVCIKQSSNDFWRKMSVYMLAGTTGIGVCEQQRQMQHIITLRSSRSVVTIDDALFDNHGPMDDCLFVSFSLSHTHKNVLFFFGLKLTHRKLEN
jgi:hypothetical protein